MGFQKLAVGNPVANPVLRLLPLVRVPEGVGAAVFDIYEDLGASEGSRAYIILAVIAFMALRAAPVSSRRCGTLRRPGFLVGVRVGWPAVPVPSRVLPGAPVGVRGVFVAMIRLPHRSVRRCPRLIETARSWICFCADFRSLAARGWWPILGSRTDPDRWPSHGARACNELCGPARAATARFACWRASRSSRSRRTARSHTHRARVCFGQTHRQSAPCSRWTGHGSWGAWGMLDVAMTGGIPHEAAWSMSRFDYLRQHPDEARIFDAMMANYPDNRHAAIAEGL